MEPFCGLQNILVVPLVATEEHSLQQYLPTLKTWLLFFFFFFILTILTTLIYILMLSIGYIDQSKDLSAEEAGLQQ